MGFERAEAARHKAAVMGILVIVLLGALLFPPTATTEAAPNPIPIVTVQLSPTVKRAEVTHNASDDVTFEGTLTIEQMDIITTTTTLTASVDTGWTACLSPSTFTTRSTATFRFQVTVTVPGGTSPEVNGSLIVTASCKAPVLAPVRGSASAVVGVRLDNSGNIWTVRILEPPEGGLVTTDTLRVRGTASYSGANVSRVDVRFCDGIWRPANGTEDWIIDIDLLPWEDGNHTVSVMAHSGRSTSPVVTSNITLDRPEAVPDGGGGDATSEPEERDWRSLLPVVILVVLAVFGAALVYLLYGRSEPETAF